MTTRSRSFRSFLAWIAVMAALPWSASVRASTSVADTTAAATPHDTVAAVALQSPLKARKVLPPGAALGIGIASTVAPVMIAALLLDPPGSSQSQLDPGAVLSLGAATGMIAGPAIGLWSGGRGDLAKKGLIVRSLGSVAAGSGVIAWWMAFGEVMNPGVAYGLMLVGAVGGIVTTGSCIHDLAIIPSATAQGRPHRAELGIRPDGVVTLRVRF